jgi:hypothetical protein
MATYTTWRDGMISGIEALTPTTLQRSSSYTYVDTSNVDPEEHGIDRGFQWSLDDPPTHISPCNKASRWRIAGSLVFFYQGTGSQLDDDQRIAEDSIQLQTWLMDKTNLDSSFELYEGPPIIDAALERLESDQYLLTLSFVAVVR